jgi:hypothetical protein
VHQNARRRRSVEGQSQYVNPVPVRQGYICDHEINFIPKKGSAKRFQVFVSNHVDMQRSKKLDQAAPVLIGGDGYRDTGQRSRVVTTGGSSRDQPAVPLGFVPSVDMIL